MMGQGVSQGVCGADVRSFGSRGPPKNDSTSSHCVMGQQRRAEPGGSSLWIRVGGAVVCVGNGKMRCGVFMIVYLFIIKFFDYWL